ncbi:hypothetical protein EFP18_24675 [Burkholderia glumae]|uniref:hypothetical protein n=1 Tax=Burkholderia glumae TaxID=337 RepID=UPI0005C2987C|nr:hypothetical protein [Burkholderia glumae]MCM2493806.1 hypothetical protein [Burkholderia glumae]MCM2546997.1 hypothetical protein [Burkholderia glumae]MCM2550564.1 hypothetical protein [Burkholderia glumae]MCQ0034035.1 hypothetical protein [Burkholderia glumae]MCQ0037592.1 hypothetical protein [Burkholderia glumae]
MRHIRFERGGEAAQPGFLALCRVVRDPSDPARFAGDVDPRRYRDWASAGPALLVIEALHQFAVKASRTMHGAPALMVPAQLRELTLHRVDGYPRLALAGTVAKHGDGYRVEVAARDADASNCPPVASGTVFVALMPAGRPASAVPGERS